MKKLINFIVLLCFLLFMLQIAVFAEDYPPILDDIDLLTDEQEEHLKSRIDEIAKTYDYHIIFNTMQLENDITFKDYYIDFMRYVIAKDGAMFFLSPSDKDDGLKFDYAYAGYGKYFDVINSVDSKLIELNNQVNESVQTKERYFEFFDGVLNILVDFLEEQSNMPVFTIEDYIGIGGMINGFDPMIDAAQIMTQTQELLLFEKIEYIHKTYDFDVTLMTMNEVPDNIPLIEYFDWYTGLDYTRDGVVFGIDLNPDTRDYATSTRNLGINAFTEDALDLIDDDIAPLLTAEKYYEAYDLFLDHTIMFVDGYKNNNPYQNSTDLIIVTVLAPLIIALVVSAIIMKFYLVPQMKTAVIKTDAERFVVDNSLILTNKTDTFTHKSTTRTKIQSSSGGGGGGTRSGYGGSRGGRSGNF